MGWVNRGIYKTQEIEGHPGAELNYRDSDFGTGRWYGVWVGNWFGVEKGTFMYKTAEEALEAYLSYEDQTITN